MNREICSVCGSWLGDDELLALRAEVEALTHDIAQYVQRDTERLTENEALRADAERYRWLRAADWDDARIVRVYINGDMDHPMFDALDAAIDAARSAK